MSVATASSLPWFFAEKKETFAMDSRLFGKRSEHLPKLSPRVAEPLASLDTEASL
jgi:hypothetical protein